MSVGNASLTETLAKHPRTTGALFALCLLLVQSEAVAAGTRVTSTNGP